MPDLILLYPSGLLGYTNAGDVLASCCCVRMARAKGAAFIPCGHTFCRACARELLAGRGRCLLCNAAIVDILDSVWRQDGLHHYARG